MGFASLVFVAAVAVAPLPSMPDVGAPISDEAYTADLYAAGLRNGYMPEDTLAEVPSSESRCLVESEAAESWLRLLVHASHDGVELEGGWCYRSFGQQVGTYAHNCPYLSTKVKRVVTVVDGGGNTHRETVTDIVRRRVCAPPTATPGNSNHGWGRAIDVTSHGRLLSCGSDAYAWLATNAHVYGWVHPGWAGCGAALQEAWHWEWGGTADIVFTGRQLRTITD